MKAYHKVSDDEGIESQLKEVVLMDLKLPYTRSQRRYCTNAKGAEEADGASEVSIYELLQAIPSSELFPSISTRLHEAFAVNSHMNKPVSVSD